MSPKPLIALDGDGVLLDYNRAYAKAWERATGRFPAERDIEAYWAIDRWDVERLGGENLEQFRACFDVDFWSTIPPLASAVEACHRLHEQGYDLVCVTALSEDLADARLRNLRKHDFPIEQVFATAHSPGGRSPKADVLDQLKPVAFVDDYLPYMLGVGGSIHKALVLREPKGSPNIGPQLSAVDSTHADLSDFVQWWLNRH
ncbi:HAD family hydrolase [Polaromonas sp. P1(28)-8]|nr:HAD family hydrolase [Polaromonas sp. P1(28)-8]